MSEPVRMAPCPLTTMAGPWSGLGRAVGAALWSWSGRVHASVAARRRRTSRLIGLRPPLPPRARL